MRAMNTGRGLLVVALFLSCGRLAADEKNDARELFDRMEKKLTEADTIQLTITGKCKIGEEATITTTFAIAKGNKARVDVIARGEGKTREMLVVSNGTRLKAGTPGQAFAEKDTPKHLSEDLIYLLTRTGFTRTLMETKPTDQTKRLNDLVFVSDFRQDKDDRLDGRDVHVIDYKFALAGEKEKFATTLYIDVKTLLPVVRTVPAYGNLREEYKYRLDEKIAAEKFDLPK